VSVRHKKTGGGGGPWIEFDSPKPAKVPDEYDYCADPPPELSERCKWWVRQIARGWRPNRFFNRECRDCRAAWLGVYLWEYLHVIDPALRIAEEVRRIIEEEARTG